MQKSVVKYCTFINNTATVNGGAIYCSSNGKVLTVNNNCFIDVTSSKNNGIYTDVKPNVEYNWWGSNNGPNADAFDNVNYSKILKMCCSIAKSAMRDGENAVEHDHPLNREESGRQYLINTEKLLKIFQNEYKTSDPGIQLLVEKAASTYEKALSCRKRAYRSRLALALAGRLCRGSSDIPQRSGQIKRI